MSSNTTGSNTRRTQHQPRSSTAPRVRPRGDELLEDVPASSTTKKSKKKLQTRGPTPQEHEASDQNTALPLTPPRNPVQLNESRNDSQASNGPASTQTKNRNRRKGNNKGAQDTPVTRQSRSPHPEQEATAITPTMTPAKPVQVYAGPTFHASPAPSALPIPRLFSKSLPQVNDKKASFKAMMQDLSESSSSNGDESPTLRSAVRAEAQKARMESPLDIFFKADREEKARRQLGSHESSLSNPIANSRAQSASPAARSLHHSRNPTETSIFPLELDSEPPAKPKAHRFDSSPSIMVSHDQGRSAEAKAKTEALKQLLMFPKNQQRPVASDLNSPSTAHRRPSPSGRVASDPPKETPSLYNSPHSTSTSAVKTRSSSRLRQELLNDVPNVEPSTPTPFHNQNMFRPSFLTGAGSDSGSSRRISTRSMTKFQAEDALRASLGNQNSSTASTELMEDQLRKILKLDTLPSTGVRS